MNRMHRRTPTRPHPGGSSSGNGLHTKHSQKKRGHAVRHFFLCVFGVALVVLTLAFSALPDPKQQAKDDEYWKSLASISVVRDGKDKTEQNKLEPAGRKVLAAANSTSQQRAAEVRDGKKQDEVEYYMVFSTACSAFQDWQSYVFFYYAMKVKQPGHVIRIASGCSDEQIASMKQIFKDRIQPMSPKFHIHYTPDFAGTGKDRYKYNNKPFGLRHFLENFLGYPDNKDAEDAIVIIVDPDQMLLQPITNDFSNTNVIWHKGPDERTGRRQPRTHVEHGSPIAQLYGFLGQPFVKVNLTYVAGQDSPALNVSSAEAGAYYPAGPPYVATVRDMYTIAFHWTNFMPKVHREYPQLLGEMFGYSIAAAHARLPHQLAQSFMVSDPDVPREGWPLFESYPTEKLCEQDAIPTESLPQVFHYCQRYMLGKWFIGKYRLDVNFISCEAPLLTEPPSDVGLQYDYYIAPGGKPYGKREGLKPSQVKRHSWSLCKMISSLNEVAVYFKKHHCDDTANFNKTYVFGPNRTEYSSSVKKNK